MNADRTVLLIVHPRVQGRELRVHSTLIRQRRDSESIACKALEEGETEVLVELEAFAGRGRLKLLVIANQDQLRGARLCVGGGGGGGGGGGE